MERKTENLKIYSRMQEALCNLRGFMLIKDSPYLYVRTILDFPFIAETSFGKVSGNVSGHIGRYGRDGKGRTIEWYVVFKNEEKNFRGRITCRLIDVNWFTDRKFELCKSFKYFFAKQEIALPSGYEMKETATLENAKREISYFAEDDSLYIVRNENEFYISEKFNSNNPYEPGNLYKIKNDQIWLSFYDMEILKANGASKEALEHLQRDRKFYEKSKEKDKDILENGYPLDDMLAIFDAIEEQKAKVYYLHH